MQFGYRQAVFPKGIIAEVELIFPRVLAAEAGVRIHESLLRRNRTQETGAPSAGCAFRNPPGAAAGRLIDEAGLKGSRIGDALVSHRHANFIVNLGYATCDDVLGLMEYLQRRVDRFFGVTLEPEVQVMGEPWPR